MISLTEMKGYIITKTITFFMAIMNVSKVPILP